jgi:hypothetical protein
LVFIIVPLKYNLGVNCQTEQQEGVAARELNGEIKYINSPLILGLAGASGSKCGINSLSSP